MNRLRDKGGLGLDLDAVVNSAKRLSSSSTSTPNINIVINQNYYDSSDRYNPNKGGHKMKLPVIISRDEDGYFIAECPSLPGCVSQGETKEEAIENIKDAIQLHRELRLEMGLSEYEETIQVEV